MFNANINVSNYIQWRYPCHYRYPMLILVSISVLHANVYSVIYVQSQYQCRYMCLRLTSRSLYGQCHDQYHCLYSGVSINIGMFIQGHYQYIYIYIKRDYTYYYLYAMAISMSLYIYTVCAKWYSTQWTYIIINPAFVCFKYCVELL